VVVSAVAGDDTVEAIEIGDNAVGVQWHPEMLTEPDPLFDWLVAAASVGVVENRKDLLVGGPDVRRHRLAGA